MLWGTSGSSDSADATQDLQKSLALLEQVLQGTWGILKLA